MKIKEIKDGVIYFTQTRTEEDVFTKESLEMAIKRNEKMLEDLDAAVMSAEGNIELNKSILDLIKEGKDLTAKEIAAGEIYFRNVKDLADLTDARPKYVEGVEALKTIMEECVALEESEQPTETIEVEFPNKEEDVEVKD